VLEYILAEPIEQFYYNQFSESNPMQPDENQFGNNKFNPGEKSTIQRLLEKKLGKEEVQVRDGPAGSRQNYCKKNANNFNSQNNYLFSRNGI
jgi:recombination DNA repair RAD52 pathway protein